MSENAGLNAAVKKAHIQPKINKIRSFLALSGRDIPFYRENLAKSEFYKKLKWQILH